MDKYITPLRIDTTKKIPYYTPGIPKIVPEDDIKYYYVTQDGDRLDTLSYKFYKRSDMWWVLARANNFANGSMAVPIGTKLYIPNIE